MGYYSEWLARNYGKGSVLVNAEFVLQKIDQAHLDLSNKIISGAYTKTEVDSLLNTKAASTHSHNEYAALSGATFTGAISAPSFTATSSVNAKKNIKAFKKSALGIIKKVNIVSFKYKKSEDPIPQVGFIAEDTDPLLSGEDQKGMRINTAIGLLLKAVQELNAKIEMLEKNFTKLKE
jgi:hypothetical protein